MKENKSSMQKKKQLKPAELKRLQNSKQNKRAFTPATLAKPIKMPQAE